MILHNYRGSLFSSAVSHLFHTLMTSADPEARQASSELKQTALQLRMHFVNDFRFLHCIIAYLQCFKRRFFWAFTPYGSAL